MAEEIAKMYEIDESPLHVKEKEVEPVKKEESSLEVDIVKPPLIETDDMPRFLDVDALTVHHNHWKCCSKGCAKRSYDRNENL